MWPYHFLVTADPEARGDQWHRVSGVYGNRASVSSGGDDAVSLAAGGGGPEPPRGQGDGMRGDGMYADGTYGDRRSRGGFPGSPRRGRRAVALIALILGVIGLLISLTGVAIQLLPRHFTAGQQRQIEAWEVMRRWQTMPAGQIFPASVSYQLSADVLQDSVSLSLDAFRVSIAPQESNCAKAVTSATVGAVLRRDGCEAVLRATYVDATRSYVMTVGVAVLPNAAAASNAASGLSAPRLAAARTAGDEQGRAGRLSAGVQVVRFGGAQAGRYDYNRQISGSYTAGPYLIMYAAGYSDSRPRVPVSYDWYSDDEMTSMARGVAHSVAATLAAPAAPPHCPGAPGC